MHVHFINAGGTLGMVGNPLRPAKSIEELLEGAKVPEVYPKMKVTGEDAPKIIDSTNMQTGGRIWLAKRIVELHDNPADAVVILHGTDTLPETCAVLSMIFKTNLYIPVFVIGAQMTKDEPGSDVKMQIENTLRTAQVFYDNRIVGIYTVCMSDILSGSRVIKRNDSDLRAFHTPGLEVAAKCYPNYVLHNSARKVDRGLSTYTISDETCCYEFERYVARFDTSADMPPHVLMDQVKTGSLKGAILIGHGSGNIPNIPWEYPDGSYSWIDTIQAATDAGIHVGITSPFLDGRVDLDRYELGKKAKEAGAFSLGSLTQPMADAKFRQAIARFPNDRTEIQRFINTNFVGELLPEVSRI